MLRKLIFGVLGLIIGAASLFQEGVNAGSIVFALIVTFLSSAFAEYFPVFIDAKDSKFDWWDIVAAIGGTILGIIIMSIV